MHKRAENMFDFMVKYSLYGVVPSMWFAYIAGISPWYGAAVGLALTALVAIPARLANVRRRETSQQQVSEF